MSLTKLPLDRYKSVMTSLFPPRESLVVTSRLGTGNLRTFFLRCRYLELPGVLQGVDSGGLPLLYHLPAPPLLFLLLPLRCRPGGKMRNVYSIVTFLCTKGGIAWSFSRSSFPRSKGGRSADKFCKLQISKFADLPTNMATFGVGACGLILFQQFADFRCRPIFSRVKTSANPQK
jgi:hypothetical protein